MTTENNPPAFPCAITDRQFPNSNNLERLPGMDLRDYFAIHASDKEIDGFIPRHDSGETLKVICRIRYAYADAMLAERNRKNGN